MILIKKASYTLAMIASALTHSWAMNNNLTSEELKAQNSAVLVYGSSHKDGNTKILLAYDKRGFWTIPGGGIKPSKNARETAADELFEETAAFPEFDPNKTRLVIDFIPSNMKISYHGHTMVYALPVKHNVDSYNIGQNWQNRVVNKSKDFKEMTNWQWVSVSDLQKSLKLNTYKMPSYTIKSLIDFDQKIGLNNLQVHAKNKPLLFDIKKFKSLWQMGFGQNMVAVELAPLIFNQLSIEEAIVMKKEMEAMNLVNKSSITKQNYSGLNNFIKSWEKINNISIENLIN